MDSFISAFISFAYRELFMYRGCHRAYCVNHSKTNVLTIRTKSVNPILQLKKRELVEVIVRRLSEAVYRDERAPLTRRVSARRRTALLLAGKNTVYYFSTYHETTTLT